MDHEVVETAGLDSYDCGDREALIRAIEDYRMREIGPAELNRLIRERLMVSEDEHVCRYAEKVLVVMRPSEGDITTWQPVEIGKILDDFRVLCDEGRSYRQAMAIEIERFLKGQISYRRLATFRLGRFYSYGNETTAILCRWLFQSMSGPSPMSDGETNVFRARLLRALACLRASFDVKYARLGNWRPFIWWRLAYVVVLIGTAAFFGRLGWLPLAVIWLAGRPLGTCASGGIMVEDRRRPFAPFVSEVQWLEHSQLVDDVVDSKACLAVAKSEQSGANRHALAQVIIGVIETLLFPLSIVVTLLPLGVYGPVVDSGSSPFDPAVRAG